MACRLLAMASDPGFLTPGERNLMTHRFLSCVQGETH
jgi:hypothetical protein